MDPLVILMILGQIVLLAGVIIQLLNDNSYANDSDLTLTLKNYVYWGLISISFIVIILTSYDFMTSISVWLESEKINEENWAIYTLIVIEIVGSLLFLGQSDPLITKVGMVLGSAGIIVTMLFYKDFKASHLIFWAFVTITTILSIKKWTFLEHNTENTIRFIVLAMVVTFLTSYMVKSWNIKRKNRSKQAIQKTQQAN
jgi:hypothetical protein